MDCLDQEEDERDEKSEGLRRRRKTLKVPLKRLNSREKAAEDSFDAKKKINVRKKHLGALEEVEREEEEEEDKEDI